MEDVLRYLVIFALQSAAVYAVAASGLVVTYTTTGVFNFAHGAIGMIIAFSFWQLSSSAAWDLPVLPSLLFCLFVLGPAIGWLLDRVLMSRLGGASTITTIVATIGLLVALVSRQKASLAIVMAFVFACLRTGSSFVASTGVERRITDVVQGLLVLALLIPPALIYLHQRRRIQNAAGDRT